MTDEQKLNIDELLERGEIDPSCRPSTPMPSYIKQLIEAKDNLAQIEEDALRETGRSGTIDRVLYGQVLTVMGITHPAALKTTEDRTQRNKITRFTSQDVEKNQPVERKR